MARHQVVLATNNAHKLIEMRRILGEHPAVTSGIIEIELLGLADFPTYDEPAETERSFEGNALIKARVCAEATGLPSLADDSGLAIGVLNGMPGVRSARWSGPGATDEANNELLLRQLHGVPDGRREATFVSAIALVFPGQDGGSGDEHVRHGEMPGRVIDELRGDNGFGYDPMFVPEGSELTYAELTAEQKDAISHRGKAVRAMVEVMIELLAEGEKR